MTKQERRGRGSVCLGGTHNLKTERGVKKKKTNF